MWLIIFSIIIVLVSVKIVSEYFAPRSLPWDLLLWMKEGRFIKWGEYEIFTVVRGEFTSPSETLVLIHGYPESANVFRGCYDHLATKFTCVVAFDFLGYGLSDKPNDIVYTIDLHAK